MASDAIDRVVFDCNVFAQAMITPMGKSGQCVDQVLDGRLRLFWSDYVLAEIRRIPNKPTPRKLGIISEVVESLIARLLPVAHLIENPPPVYNHPLDPKDSHYVDLAVATDSKLIVRSDKHLLNLMRPQSRDRADFIHRFPAIAILQPWQLIELLRSRGAEPGK
jgi:putative PIN family toxin of toxin-antitoxin system